jgi:hypothetical protein
MPVPVQGVSRVRASSHTVVCRGSLTPDLVKDNLSCTPTRKLPRAMRKLPGLLLQEEKESLVCLPASLIAFPGWRGKKSS